MHGLTARLALVAWALLVTVACADTAGESATTSGTIEDRLFPSGEVQQRNVALVEQLVIECMAEQGFSYSPQERSAEYYERGPQFATLKAVLDLEDEPTGFGITSYSKLGLGVEDPNLAAKALLTDAELELWDQGRGACFTEANDQVNGEWFAQVTPLAARYEEVEQRIAADPTVLRIEADWARCMRNQGFQDFDSVEDMLVDLANDVNDFIPSLARSLAEAGEVSLDDYHQAWYDQLVERERATAMNAKGCMAEFEEEYLLIRQELESEFPATVSQIPVLPSIVD